DDRDPDLQPIAQPQHLVRLAGEGILEADPTEIARGEPAAMSIAAATRLHQQAASHLEAGREGTGVALLRKIIWDHPPYEDARVHLASVLNQRWNLGRGSLDDLRESGRLIASLPETARWHYLLAIQSRFLGLYSDMIRHLRRAVELDPDDPLVQMEYGGEL